MLVRARRGVFLWYAVGLSACRSIGRSVCMGSGTFGWKRRSALSLSYFAQSVTGTVLSFIRLSPIDCVRLVSWCA